MVIVIVFLVIFRMYSSMGGIIDGDFVVLIEKLELLFFIFRCNFIICYF